MQRSLFVEIMFFLHDNSFSGDLMRPNFTAYLYRSLDRMIQNIFWILIIPFSKINQTIWYSSSFQVLAVKILDDYNTIVKNGIVYSFKGCTLP